ncbi:unnamed protein product, partial [Bubo scandiacus]
NQSRFAVDFSALNLILLNTEARHPGVNPVLVKLGKALWAFIMNIVNEKVASYNVMRKRYSH